MIRVGNSVSKFDNLKLRDSAMYVYMYENAWLFSLLMLRVMLVRSDES